MYRVLITAGVRAFFSGSWWSTEKGVFYGVLSAARSPARCLAYLFCLIVTLLFSAQVWAFAPGVTWSGKFPSANSPTITGSSGAEACNNIAAWGNTCTNCGDPTNPATGIRPIKGVYQAPNNCYLNKANGSGWTSTPVASSSTCPANSTLSGGQCTCNVGFAYDIFSSQCINRDEEYCKRMLANATGLGDGIGPRWIAGKVSSGSICDDAYDPPGGSKGCRKEWEMEMATQVQGAWRTYGTMRAASSGPYACTEGSSDPGPPKQPDNPTQPDTCKPPQVAGTVNGQTLCYTPNAGDPRETKPTTTTTTETKDNGDGTSTTTTRTTTTQTTCTNGSCNTTTTTTTNIRITNNTTGDTVSNTTNTTNGGTTNPLTEFCKSTPKSPLCMSDSGDDGGKSAFGGSCTAGFQCKGDAIQCAIARDQHIRNCQAFDATGTPEQAAYDNAKGKTGNQTGDNPNNETIDLNTALDTSDAIGGGTGGMSDVTVTVWKSTITLPFSMVNQYLGYLGNLLVAISFLVAFRIVTRG